MGIRKMLLLLICSLAISCGALRAADEGQPQFKPFLHPLFNSHMVFPREVAAPVWGWTNPGGKVTVSMNDRSAEALAAADGKWMLKLGPFTVGGPYQMTVSTSGKTVKLDDILIGDVWLCSGQSNMTMGINSVNDAKQEVANANHPGLRYLDIPPWRPEADHCDWKVCTPAFSLEAASWKDKETGELLHAGFSALAYFFGRGLQKDLNIPIGLVQTSCPGSAIEMWSSAEALNPIVKRINAPFDEWFKKNDPDAAAFSSANFDDSTWQTISYPVKDWSNAPKFKGILWIRRDFEIPPAFAGKELALNFGWLGGMASVWVNGEFLGHLSPEGAARIPVTALKNGKNTIAMRYLNIWQNKFGIVADKAENIAVSIYNRKNSFSLAGDWKYKAAREFEKFDGAVPSLPRVRCSDAAMGGGGMFRGFIKPLSPFAFKGVLWYQGEANSGEGATTYFDLHSALVKDWRHRFPSTELPFIIVQIANCSGGNPDGWQIPYLREAQARVAAEVPDVAMANAADIGEEKDQHPKNKQEIGRRTVLAALEKVYGKKIDSSGPVFKKLTKEGAKLRVEFDHVGTGLLAKDGKLNGFFIADAKGNFVQADAVIEGNAVVLSSPAIANPEHVRYGWRNWGGCDLYNREMLPAFQFRTDSFPMK
ncbi:MAG: sialate O-acetylesterase [Victivallales bacterium]|jgi:sialate O-acetylesterase